MPPLIGYAAASGTLTWDAWILFAILFLWQFPHFYAIAWMYREDYERAGIRMLPVVEPDGESTARRILWFSLALIPISLVPKFLAMTGNVYLIGAAAHWAAVSVRRAAHQFRSNPPASPPCSARLRGVPAGFVRLDAFRSRCMKFVVAAAIFLFLTACLSQPVRCRSTTTCRLSIWSRKTDSHSTAAFWPGRSGWRILFTPPVPVHARA